MVNKVICHMIKGVCRRISGVTWASKWNSLERESLQYWNSLETGGGKNRGAGGWGGGFLHSNLNTLKRTGTAEPRRPEISSLVAAFHSEPLSSGLRAQRRREAEGGAGGRGCSHHPLGWMRGAKS